MISITRIVFLFCFLARVPAFAQNGELGQFDCTYSRPIVIPFNYTESGSVASKPLLNQKVFYNSREQFSFWYKILVKEDHILDFKVTPLNDSDAYSVFVYHYNQPDICNKVFHQKIQPVKSTFFIGKGQGKVNENEKKFQAVKNNVYYISVLNTSLNNCGHRLLMVYGKDTLKVDAVHLPCKRDVAALSVNKNLKNKEEPVALVMKSKDSVSTVPVYFKDTIVSQKEESFIEALSLSTLNKSNKKPVDAIVTIFSDSVVADALTTGKGEFNVILRKKGVYTIKAEALGYKPIQLKVNAKDWKQKGKEIVFLEPLKEGESFVMKSIYFFPNTYALRKESKDELEKLLAFMKVNENAVIEIQGHTNGDNRIYKNSAYSSFGGEWNFTGSSKKLSQKRAEVIRTYLMNNGISGSRLIAKGYGGKKFLVKDPESNEEAQRNIRVEVAVLKN